ncbi:hypothetical protein ACFQ0B_30005 [Nonomuraea thailandensis]
MTYPALRQPAGIEIADDRGRNLGRRSRDLFAAPERGQALGESSTWPPG